MVKIPESIIVDAVNFLDQVLEEGFIPQGYTLEELEELRNDLDNHLNQNEMVEQ